MKTATFGAGCFWGVEEAFRQVEGVIATAVGYSGGSLEHPTYKDVCSGRTGHAEVVQLEFDPEKITYEQLLDLFWSLHDPTQLNRQGPDTGTQYRTVIFFHHTEQENAARRSLDVIDKSGRLGGPVVTEILPAETFWRAEDYHQQYISRGGRGACAIRPGGTIMMMLLLAGIAASSAGCYERVVRAEGLGSKTVDIYEPNVSDQPDLLDDLMWGSQTHHKKKR